MNIKEKREKALKEIEDLEKLFEKKNEELALLDYEISTKKKQFENLKIKFKRDRLSESGTHDTHYWLRMSVETPIGTFSHDQWDSTMVEWPKNLLEYIAKNKELFDEEDLKMFCESKSLEYIELFEAQEKIKEKLEKY